MTGETPEIRYDERKQREKKRAEERNIEREKIRTSEKKLEQERKRKT